MKILTLKEEFDRLVEEESEDLKKHIHMLVETQLSVNGKEYTAEKKKELISQALKANLMSLAMSNTIDNIVAWINEHDKPTGYHDVDEFYKDED